jgi:hypothetical protein
MPYNLVQAHMPTAIIWPSIVNGTLSDPIPGFVEGYKVGDPIIMAYGRNQIPGFLFLR